MKTWPTAQFLNTDALGPPSNAHGIIDLFYNKDYINIYVII